MLSGAGTNPTGRAFKNFEKDLAADRLALKHRRLRFRNALMHVALEVPLSGATAAAPLRLPDEDAPRPPHVLVIDDSRHARELHRALILACSPSATVKTASSAAEALEICSHDVDERQFDLIVLDFNLSRDDPETSEALRNLIFDQVSGFSVSETLKQAEASEAARHDFTCTPLIAMVTSYADKVIVEKPQSVDGSVGGCDVILPKPLSSGLVRVLIESCVV